MSTDSIIIGRVSKDCFFLRFFKTCAKVLIKIRNNDKHLSVFLQLYYKYFTGKAWKTGKKGYVQTLIPELYSIIFYFHQDGII
jgi:hypothetical protein